jgi:hypothetical protein
MEWNRCDLSMKLVLGPNHQIQKMPESESSAGDSCHRHCHVIHHLILFSTTPWDYILTTAYLSRTC